MKYRGPSLSGKRVLLVEDVLTTGATTSASAYTLFQAGALSVDVIALARAHVWTKHRAKIADIFSD